MKTKENKNEVVKIANRNQTIILAKTINLSKADNKTLDKAWCNEGCIANDAEQLEGELERGIRELTEALNLLRKNSVMSLNASGILQNTNSKIDRLVISLQEKMSTRRWYSELIK